MNDTADDEFYQLKFGTNNGQIDYKNLFKFNKSIIDDDCEEEHNSKQDDKRATESSSFSYPYLTQLNTNLKYNLNENISKYDYMILCFVSEA